MITDSHAPERKTPKEKVKPKSRAHMRRVRKAASECATGDMQHISGGASCCRRPASPPLNKSFGRAYKNRHKHVRYLKQRTLRTDKQTIKKWLQKEMERKGKERQRRVARSELTLRGTL